ncbi:MAG TPA: hypothetical protein VJ225_01480 [Nitrososphaeraceae archaeon]|jgi:hypothetical protein|nr:hypothetical protein [Nitrososphaeraceae archaeon]
MKGREKRSLINTIRPQGERMERELKFDENSRPKGQKKVLED